MKRVYREETNDEKPGAQLSVPVRHAFASRPNGKRPIETDDLLQEIESLRTRLSKLSEASRRVSEDLDLNIVLQEVIDSARYLTGARYGALLTYEPSGAIQDFITSGLSAEEIERLKTLPQGLGLADAPAHRQILEGVDHYEAVIPLNRPFSPPSTLRCSDISPDHRAALRASSA